LRLYDRLPAAVTLELPSGSRIALAFVTGKRYEISGPAHATLGPGDLTARSGSVRALAPVPPLPSLKPIPASDHPGATAGAFVIRGERITGLYPRHGAAALSEETVLHFKPVQEAGEYRIEVQDGQGRTVFQTDTASPPMKVPAGVLHSGHYYWWTVRTLDRPGPVAQGGAELITLSASVAGAREKAREILAAEGDDSLPLLAEIDCGLGLLLEARQELKEAESHNGDPTIRKALAEIEMWMEDRDDSK
jgi:hypothetical protein